MTAAKHVSLRLLFPQWQGTPAESLRARLPRLSTEQAATAHEVGARLLALLAPASDAETVEVPVSSARGGPAVCDGIYARDVVLTQLRSACAILKERDPDRVLVLGGDASVSLAPFAHLAGRYARDLAVLWFSAEPPLAVPGDTYPGFHAMALATLLGVGDAEFTRALPALVEPAQVLLVGVRAGTPEVLERQQELGIAGIPPDRVVTARSRAVVDWLHAADVSHVAIHVDLGVLHPDELDAVAASSGPGDGGLGVDELVQAIGDVADASSVVGVSVTEHTPRAEILVRHLLHSLPLR